jgi:(p)ppGpp synthase/HD superfamily hydrolase
MKGSMSNLQARIEASPLVRRAHETAGRAHAGLRRKASPDPQFSHPEAVAGILAGHGFGDAVLAAALLHDVLEDTPVEEATLERAFPERVVGIVRALTEPPVEGPRSETWERRKEGKIAALATADAEALAVCAADRLHNVRSLIEAVRERGPAAWEAFTRGPAETLGFERKVEAILAARLFHPLVDEYRDALRELEALVAGRPGP